MVALSISIPEPQAFDSLLSLKGRCAVVTGGSRGLGRAIVQRLAEAGAAVVLTGRGREAVQRVESEVNATGGQALGVQADLASLNDSQTVIDQAVERFGRVDILVNNAAVFPPSMFVEVSAETWDYTVDTDLKGAYFLGQFAAKAMIAADRGGRIINVLSTDAFRPTGMLSAYGAAKLGLWSATQAMAKELATHRILVNALTPGSIITQERIEQFNDGTFGTGDMPEGAVQTREKMQAAVKSGGFAQMLTTMMPLGRPGYPDEIAKSVLFLASDMASYISGANLLVDGAQTLR
jgi:NAD(P)-dependent dehydrogenase (short-subunit alcohol dehydrogenase family)